MKGDFTRFTHDAKKHYTRVLKQQGRVDLDADWNESVEILTQLDRTEAIDVIGNCGVPEHSNGFRVELTGDGSNLTISPGRMYVDGILCANDAEAPVLISEQTNLPDFTFAEADGVYIAYVDVWERHITYVEDPDIRETALGGPDTTTRTQTVCQVKLALTGQGGPLDTLECRAFEPLANTGLLTALTETGDLPTNPCVLPAGAGYTGLENRLYRVEIHDDGRDESGHVVRTPTFKWSRDNGSVLLPIADDGIDGDVVTVRRLGHDEVLTVNVGDWVEISADHTELKGQHGTLAKIKPDGIDKATLEINLSEDVSAYNGGSNLKMRRWDHHATGDVALQDGALPIQADPFELEDGVLVSFDTDAAYNVGDYWLIPARSREGDILWPRTGATYLPQARLGIHHHYCTLALLRREGGVWTERRDCRPLFPPLTEVSAGGCCVRVLPGEDIQQAIDTVIGRGGGCISLCRGVHEVAGFLTIDDASDVRISGENGAVMLRFVSPNRDGAGGLVIRSSQRIAIEDMFIASDSVHALVSLLHDDDLDPNRQIAFRRLTLLNLSQAGVETHYSCAFKLGQTVKLLMQDCQVVAEVGVITLRGNRLPDISSDREPGGEQPAGEQINIDFEDLEAGSLYRVGDSFVAAGVTVQAGVYEWPTGETTTGGNARVLDRQEAGGTGLDIWTNNINLDFKLDNPQDRISLQFGSFGGNHNVRVNGELRNVNNLYALDGETIGGVAVSVKATSDDNDNGMMTLHAADKQITAFAIGGQEFAIDNVTLGRGESQVPELEFNIGDGVVDADLERNHIRYLEYGILAAVAQRWSIHNNTIKPHAGLESLAELYVKLVDSTDAAPSLLTQLQASLRQPVEIAQGTAIHGHLWADNAVTACRLSGARAMDIWWWFRGEAGHNSIEATQIGLNVFWLHDADIHHNRISDNSSTAVSHVGSYRARMHHNHLRCYRGIVNVNANAMIKTLPQRMNVIARAYRSGDAQLAEIPVSQLSLYVLYSAVVEFTLFSGARGVVNRLAPMFGNYDPLLFFTLLFHANLNNSKQRFNYPIPVIDLRIADNDIEASDVCVYLDNAFTLGGIRVCDNRLHTLTGQAVRLNSGLFTANPHLGIALWRMLFKYVIDPIVPMLIEVMANAQELPNIMRTAIVSFLRGLLELMTQWSKESEVFLEADCRVCGNSIRSLATAIETNLWGVVINHNHITLQERRYSNIESVSVIGALLNNVNTAPIGYAMRDGSSDHVRRASYAMAAEGVLTDTETRGDVAAVIYDVSSGISNVPLTNAGNRLAEAINAGDERLVLERVETFVIALANLVDNYGIWVKAPGCQISHNHVLVPEDVEQDTRARGGVRISSDSEDQNGDQLSVLGLLAVELGMDPLLGVTETRIDNNEIVGGFGHGVHIQAPVIVNQLQFGLYDLKIAHNQIVGMAGGGIVLDEETVAVGVDILDNKISLCSTQPDLASLTNEHGGIVVENAALCRINGNRIRHCGSGQESIDVFAIALESVYGLALNQNCLECNGSESAGLDNGSVNLADVYGDVQICHNEFLFQRGVGLLWNNSLSSNELPLPQALINNVIFYLQGADGFSGQQAPVVAGEEARSSRASIQHNQFRVADDVETQAFNLFNLQQLDFSGNHANNTTTEHLGTITNVIEWLLATNNTFKTNAENSMIICKAASGIVDNNVGDKPIGLVFSAVQAGANIPPVTS